MSCRTVQKSLSAFLDQALSRTEMDLISVHLSGCRECDARKRELAGVTTALRALPGKKVPAQLASQLQVLASHERARRLAGPWHIALGTLRLAINNLMRPVAIPVTGGLASAMFLFSMLTPTLTIRAADARTDVPAYHWLYTQGTMIDTPPFGFQGNEIQVVLTLDKNGQITDYSCSDGKVSRQVMDNIGNTLLFSSFEPPTMFGMPMAGKLRVTFKKIGDHIVVRPNERTS
jgi:putative zinc finger protein